MVVLPGGSGFTTEGQLRIPDTPSRAALGRIIRERPRVAMEIKIMSAPIISEPMESTIFGIGESLSEWHNLQESIASQSQDDKKHYRIDERGIENFTALAAVYRALGFCSKPEGGFTSVKRLTFKVNGVDAGVISGQVKLALKYKGLKEKQASDACMVARLMALGMCVGAAGHTPVSELEKCKTPDQFAEALENMKITNRAGIMRDLNGKTNAEQASKDIGAALKAAEKVTASITECTASQFNEALSLSGESAENLRDALRTLGTLLGIDQQES